MKTRPTVEQVNVELAALRGLEGRVRPFTAFGDDNRAAISAQIHVLEEHMSADRAHEVYGEDAFIDEDEFDQYVFDCAIEAADWLAGDLASDLESPSDNWKGIAS